MYLGNGRLCLQVLGSVKNRIEAFAASHEDFPAMLRKAQQYLVARSKVDWSDPPGAVPPLRRSDSLGECGFQTGGGGGGGDFLSR